jgi:peptide/nickel transport system substrate-binding protein
MKYRYTRLRVRRRIRKRKKQVVSFSELANKQLDRHIFRRWHNFRSAGRFSVGWLSLVIILIVAVVVQTKGLGQFYLSTVPVGGGVYTEGIVGNFSNANPLFTTDDVDASVSKLLFCSLLTYDENNQLVGDLASSWEVDAKGTTYTVKLKPNLFWHDGQPLTADDVVFTYDTIKNPDAKSYLLQNWTGVKIEKVDKNTVRFILPNAYSPFPHSLTNGIVPQHILKDIPASQLRSAPFNTKDPIGSGPFVWKGVTIDTGDNSSLTETIQFAKFYNYHAGIAKLDGVTINTYKDENSLNGALQKNQIIAAVGLSSSDKDINPGEEDISFNLMSANMLFLKTTSPLLNDVKVRQALVKATNVPSLVEKIDYPTIPVREPILESQIGYNPIYQQFSFNKQEAQKLLDEAGWIINPKDNIRYKNGKKFTLRLAYQSNHEFSHIADGIQKQWADVGVNLAVTISQDENDSRKYLDSHDYDVLLYGINIGPDPDVYAYWHSSQISNKSQVHLNLSEYKSAVADLALEAARTRTDAKLRAAKYKPFLEAWRRDAPAIGLYQPRYLLISNTHIYGLKDGLINIPSDRFNNINNWMINTARKSEN